MSLLRKKDIAAMLANSSNAAGLEKTLGVIDLFFLGIGALVGTGIFVLIGTGAVIAGPALSTSFIVAGIACAFVALSYAEFSSSMPVTGSLYTYCYATLGEIVAWMIGWILTLEYGVAVSAVAVGWSGYFQSLAGQLGWILPKALTAAPGSLEGVHTIMNVPALAIVLAITGLLCIGIKESVRINNVMVILKVGVILLVIIVGAFYVRPSNWHPYIPHGISSISAAAAIIFFSFIGFDAVTAAAEEVKNPQRNLPIGIIGSLAICVLLYFLIALVMTGMVPYEKFIGVDNPISMVFHSINQNWVAAVVDISAIFGMLTVILVMTYTQARLIFAMARDGLLPQFFSHVHSKSATPIRATLFTGIVFGLLAALVPLNELAELVNIGALTAFGAVSFAVIVLRRTFPDLKRPFRCPGMPYIPLAAFCACLFLMLQLSLVTWISFIMWIAVGLIIYFSYSKYHSKLRNQ